MWGRHRLDSLPGGTPGPGGVRGGHRAFDDRVVELHPGDLFYVPPVRHDSWVVGDEPYVSFHFLGADQYAR